MSNDSPSKKAIKDELWRRGVLSYKLDTVQKELYELFHNSNHKIMTWLLSRRQGKTYTLCILALEQCIRKPHSIVKFVAPTKTQVNTNCRPLFRQILADCPEDIRPEFREKDYIYYFPNGSEIQLAGTDNNHAEKLRGGDSDIFIIDEAGSCSDLNNVVKSILLPTTLITKGKGILASTPPKDPEHEFLGFIEQCQENGAFVKKTIFDNPRIDDEQRNELIREVGGLHTEEARRELMCELIKDSTTSVVPEFTEALEKEIVREWPKPPFYDTYVSMDLGYKDMTAVIFAYYDFRAGKIIIQDEVPFRFNEQERNIKYLTKLILEKEKELWWNYLTNEIRKPYIRVSDINMIVTNEIRNESNNELNFVNAKKDDKEAAINTLRTMLAAKKIIIDPKCKTLLQHLRNVKWQKNKSVFAHSNVDGSHYDFVDALVYLVRHMHFKKNPYPATYDLSLRSEDVHIQNPESFARKYDNQSVYRQIFGLKNRK